jgi:hypothetical protein
MAPPSLLRLFPSFTGDLPPLADSPATALRRNFMLASMNAERVLSSGEGDMVRPNQVQAGMLGLALLAGGEFSYAHLRHLGLWPLELLARSMWRLAGLLASAVFPNGALWVAPVVLALGALLAWGIAAWRGQPRTATPAPEGRHHE